MVQAPPSRQHDPAGHEPEPGSDRRPSRTETKIAEESELGSDRAGGDTPSADALRPDLPDELSKRPKGPAQP
jgi:hypothetical protein